MADHLDETARHTAETILVGRSRSLVQDAQWLANDIKSIQHRLGSPRARPRVGLDIDGPVADFIGGYGMVLSDVLTRMGRTWDPSGIRELVTGDAIHKCAFFEDLAEDVDLSADALRARVDVSLEAKGFCANLSVQPGAIEAVGALAEIADIFPITSPWETSPHWEYERRWWIDAHFGATIRANVIQASRKHFGCFDVFVDDKPSHVSTWAQHWPGRHAVLFEMPHNASEVGRDYLLREKITRAGWPFIIEVTTALAAK